MPPIIGITTYHNKVNDLPYVMLVHAYVEAVMAAGGIPVLIPSLLADGDWHALYDRLDGLLLSGGGDIEPDYFGGDAHPRIDGVDLQRDRVELSLVRLAVEDGKPFLGICRGIQVVNVSLGGTLYTHIPDQLRNAIDHTYPGNMRTTLVHEVVIEQDTRLSGILGELRIQVNSLHHQGLKGIAPGLRVSGYAPDALVEAVEIPDHPFGIGVQWHPEWLTGQQATRNLFKAFVDAAEKGKPVNPG